MLEYKMDNLIVNPPVRHRELFTGGIFSKDRKAKATYTLQDVWNYAHLVYLGGQLPSPSICNKEEREARKHQILSDVGPILPRAKEIILEYVKRYGLEIVLMAIEECYSQDSERMPDIEDVDKYLREAQAIFARMAHKPRVEN